MLTVEGGVEMVDGKGGAGLQHAAPVADVWASDADDAIEAENCLKMVDRDGGAGLHYVALAAAVGAGVCRGRWVVW